MALTKIPSSLLDTSGGFDLQGNITLGANEEVQFGDASELKIFNDGSNSVIRSSDNLLIQRNTTPRNAITITDSTGEVALAYGGSTVFQTSSTGATVTGNLAVTGDLDITGNINSYNVTDLDVTDKTITLGAGQTEANSGGSGIIIDGSSASILWDETNNEWDLNKSINVTGSITSSGITYMNRTGDGNFINFNSDGSEVGSIETQGNEIVLMSVDRGLRIRKSTSNSIIPVGTGRTNLDDTMSLGSSGARFTTLYLSDNILNWGKAGSVTVFNQDGTTADFRVESTGEQHMLFVDGGLNRIGMANSAPNAKLHIDSTAATGDATNPALQIGGTTTYRLGMYTTSEGGVIDNANGDDGLQFHTKNVGEAVRITANGNLQMIGQTSSFESPGLTYHTNNYLYLRGGTSGLILADDSGINTVQIIDGASGYINFETGDGSSRMRIDANGNVGIGNTPQTIYPTFDSLQIGPNKSMILGRSENNLFGTTSNAYINSSGSWTYVSNGLAAMTEMINGEHHWFTASSGTANNAITFQRRMSIMSSGRVGIGTNNPSGSLHLTTVDSGGADVHYVAQNTSASRIAGYKVLDESGNNQVSLTYDNGSNRGNLNLGQADGEILYVYGGSTIKSGFGIDLSGSSRELSIFHTSSGTNGNIALGKRLESNGTFYETVQVTPAGTAGTANLIVHNVNSNSFNHVQENKVPNLTAGEDVFLGLGKATSSKNMGYLGYEWNASGSDNNYIHLSHWGADGLFRVYGNGNYSFSGSNISDRDLKENIVAITDTALDKVTQLVVKKFNFIKDYEVSSDGTEVETPRTQVGFIAQEVEAIIPDITVGTDGQKDMGVDTVGLVGYLTKAIQELSAKLEAAEARITELEG